MEQPPSKANNHKPEKPQKTAPSNDVNKNMKGNTVPQKEIKSGQKENQEVAAIKGSNKEVNNSTTPKEAKKTENTAPTKPQDIPVGPASPNLATPSGISVQPPVPEPAAELVEMGGGLPALPPRPVAPIRQAVPSASASSYNNGLPQRVPNLKQVSKPQFNIPPGSDLGAVGKIGVYQMSHKSAATDIHANLIFWVYIVTLITTFFLIKRK